MAASEKPPKEPREVSDPAAAEPKGGAGKTPNTDMQPDDTGSAAGGSGRGTAAEAAMKQTSKTAHESGSQG
jgi:hypothetical protein